MSETNYKELIIKPIEVANVESNFEEVKTSLVAVLDKYQNLIFTDATIPDAKTTRAQLNKVKKSMEDKRKEIKKEYLKPYNDFEAKVKELVGLVDKPVLHIDSQIKFYEQNLRDDKQKLIDSIKVEISEQFGFSVPIFNESWLNQSVSKKKIEDEINEFYTQKQNEVEIIKNFNSELENKLLEMLYNGVEITSILQEKQKFDDAKKIIESKKEIVAETPVKNIEPVENIEPPKPQVVNNEKVSFTIQITCTVDAKNELKEFMANNNIEVKVI